jgi:hypothetical protein
MRGTLDLGIASYNLTVDPNGAAVIGDQDLQVGWFLWQCGMFGCTYTSGMSTYTHNVGNVPVDVRFGQLRGYGTLTWAGPATCSASCPPPGANVWYVPQPYSQLTAAVSSKDEAGTLNLYGPGPLIQ